MLVCFTLSMPSRASWNNRWSGEDRCYSIIRLFRGKQAVANAEKILGARCFYYRWSDGWSACVRVEHINSSQAANIRKRSDGFCGYDWMVSSIIEHGEIRADKIAA